MPVLRNVPRLARKIIVPFQIAPAIFGADEEKGAPDRAKNGFRRCSHRPKIFFRAPFLRAICETPNRFGEPAVAG
jgi:hypothetical protein